VDERSSAGPKVERMIGTNRVIMDMLVEVVYILEIV
jgi:hypothetical protein